MVTIDMPKFKELMSKAKGGYLVLEPEDTLFIYDTIEGLISSVTDAAITTATKCAEIAIQEREYHNHHGRVDKAAGAECVHKTIAAHFGI